MALISRLVGRTTSLQFLRNEKCGLLSVIRPVTLQAQPAPKPKRETHDEHNMRLGRPQSPHLTIYAPQMTSMLSISHRGTGLAMAGYAVILGFGGLFTQPETIPNLIDSLACMNISPVLLIPGKFALAFPLTYHFWNGIRHLCWDMGKFLSIKHVYLTGYVMLALSFASAGALAMI